jgi:tetratricopeptide (TPR) repeat protein
MNGFSLGRVVRASLVAVLGGVLVRWPPPVRICRAQELTEDQQAARTKLNQGVQAYRQAQFGEAIEDFKQAAQLGPLLLPAHLYIATAYASQFIPGDAISRQSGFGQAMDQFQFVLGRDLNSLPAIDGLRSILHSMGGNPFDRSKLDEAKPYCLKHIKISPSDPQPYY